MPNSRRIVLTTFGSLGDLHPFLALALGLKERGHRPILCTLEEYRAKIELMRIEFAPIRPSLADFGDPAELLRNIMDSRNGPEFVIRKVVAPHIRNAHADLLPVARGADFIVSHVLTVATPIVAEQLGIPWASTTLQPMALFSAHDFPVLNQGPWLAHWRWLGPRFHRALIGLVKRMSRPWLNDVVKLRAELGLPTASPDLLFDGQYSPRLNLALFSVALARPQPDWPKNTVVTGFPIFDRDEQGEGMSADLLRFLDAGSPPVVFTLGSSGVHDAGSFYSDSAKTAQQLGIRAVLLIGKDERNRPAQPLPDSIHVADYAPYSELFPRAAAIVHQCGVGTTAQAMRAGVPVLAVPFSHDQPDNADRLRRLGVARVLHRHQYGARRAADQLQRLLADRLVAGRARSIGERVRSEDGVAVACDAIDRQLSNATLPA